VNRPPNSHSKPSGKRPGGRRKRKGRAPHSRSLTPDSPENIMKRHGELEETYFKARHVYFEEYFRCDSQRLAKLERLRFEALKKLREFEDKIQEKEVAPMDRYPRDLDFSFKHPDDEIFSGEAELPRETHISEIQVERPSYAKDREETSGGPEDLEKYKISKS
jgi:hypothetical protein